MIIALAADHAGFSLKQRVSAHLRDRGIGVLDPGTFSGEAVDYPDYVRPGAQLSS